MSMPPCIMWYMLASWEAMPAPVRLETCAAGTGDGRKSLSRNSGAASGPDCCPKSVAAVALGAGAVGIAGTAAVA